MTMLATFTYYNGSPFPMIDVDPAANRRFGINVANLLAPGDSVVTFTATCEDASLQISEVVISGTLLQVRLSNFGAAGRVVDVSFTWETAQGDEDNRTLSFRVTDL